MKGIGSGDNGELTFLDMLSIISFWVGFQNLDSNITQSDKQDFMQELSNKSDLLLKEIHSHLKEQDEKIDYIMEKLNGTHS